MLARLLLALPLLLAQSCSLLYACALCLPPVPLLLAAACCYRLLLACLPLLSDVYCLLLVAGAASCSACALLAPAARCCLLAPDPYRCWLLPGVCCYSLPLACFCCCLPVLAPACYCLLLRCGSLEMCFLLHPRCSLPLVTCVARCCFDSHLVALQITKIVDDMHLKRSR